MAHQHIKVIVCQMQKGKPAQGAKDDQQYTLHITLCYTIMTM